MSRYRLRRVLGIIHGKGPGSNSANARANVLQGGDGDPVDGARPDCRYFEMNRAMIHAVDTHLESFLVLSPNALLDAASKRIRAMPPESRISASSFGKQVLQR